MDNLFYHLWRWWIDLFAGWGLPVNKHTLGMLSAMLLCYGIGYGFKRLTEKEK